VNKGQGRNGHAAQHSGCISGHGGGFQASLANEPVLILAALVTVYLVLGVLV
jgi:multidrug efflux pump